MAGIVQRKPFLVLSIINIKYFMANHTCFNYKLVLLIPFVCSPKWNLIRHFYQC
jgi:hypothetical protein